MPKKKKKELGFGDKWKDIEKLIIIYKGQYKEGSTEADKVAADKAITEVLESFAPLFKKYLGLVKTGYMNLKDLESKRFVANFLGDATLKTAMYQKSIPPAIRNAIFQRFNFVKETYGALDEVEIMADLQALFMQLAHRYKPMGRSYCAYVYKAYAYEVARHIKSFIKNPANIPYRANNYEEYMQDIDEPVVEDSPFEDKLFETRMGVPSLTWITGENCANEFRNLSRLERTVLVRYYLEDQSDAQIAENMCLPQNYVNNKRHTALEKLTTNLGVDMKSVLRKRRTAKKKEN